MGLSALSIYINVLFVFWKDLDDFLFKNKINYCFDEKIFLAPFTK